MTYTIGDVARLARVSVRTLHHYDELGLLQPSGRSPAGYRLYTDADLARLQEVLFHRELGLPLEDIRGLLADPQGDRLATLTRQRATLVAKIHKLEAMLRLVDATIDRMKEGLSMSANELFGDFDPTPYEDEVRERWGNTAAYAESRRRTKGYTKDDWAALSAEVAAIHADFIALLDAGVPATDPRATALAERHRLHMDRWFYPCSHAMHRGLAEMYLADPRFTRFYDDQREGLARYVHDAISASCDTA